MRGPLSTAALALAEGDGERAVLAARAAADALRGAPIPEELVASVTTAWRELISESLADGQRVLLAVRSSAGAEDGRRHSHAGQFESVLNVSGLAATWDAIREVWASWFSERAVRYRLHVRAEGAPRDEPPVPAMAVVVQRMVVPRASGILFTADPVTGSRKEMTLEAGPGLGEALAQGRIHPDYCKVRRSPLRIVERSVAPHVGRLDPLPPGSGELLFRVAGQPGNDRIDFLFRPIFPFRFLNIKRIDTRKGCRIQTVFRHRTPSLNLIITRSVAYRTL